MHLLKISEVWNILFPKVCPCSTKIWYIWKLGVDLTTLLHFHGLNQACGVKKEFYYFIPNDPIVAKTCLSRYKLGLRSKLSMRVATKSKQNMQVKDSTHSSGVLKNNLYSCFVGQLFPKTIWSKYQEQVFWPQLSKNNGRFCCHYWPFQRNRVTKLLINWVPVKLWFL